MCLSDRSASHFSGEYTSQGNTLNFVWPGGSTEMSIYYTVEGFYSSHRLFVDSKPYEIYGTGSSCKGMSTVSDFKRVRKDFMPAEVYNAIQTLSDDTHLWPCGAAAFSLFDDHFKIERFVASRKKWVELSINRDSNSWLGPPEKEIQKKIIDLSNKAQTYPPDRTGSPPSPSKSKYSSSEADNVPINERVNWLPRSKLDDMHLYLWMRPRPSSSFNNFYGAVDLRLFKKYDTDHNDDDVKADQDIEYRIVVESGDFPTDKWDIRKGIQIVEPRPLGSSLYKFGYMSMFFGVCLIVIVLVLTYLSWSGFYSPAPSVVMFNKERQAKEVEELARVVRDAKERGIVNPDQARQMERVVRNGGQEMMGNRIDQLNVSDAIIMSR